MTDPPSNSGPIPTVGPARPWPRQDAPATDPDGRSEDTSPPPDPLRPSGSTTLLPCPSCGGAGKTWREGMSGPSAAVTCVPCGGGGRREGVWATSTRDRRWHAFVLDTEPAEAMCKHSVPWDLVTGAVSGVCIECAHTISRLEEQQQIRRRWNG